MAAMYLPKGSLISWASKAEYDPLNPSGATWHDVSEHNRAPVQVSVERIENSHRTVSGTMRKWFVADKRSWSTSWESLPHTSTFTVDEKWGGSEIENFYNIQYGDFWLRVRLPDGSDGVYQVVFKDFSKTIEKRGRYEFWNVDISLEEV